MAKHPPGGCECGHRIAEPTASGAPWLTPLSNSARDQLAAGRDLLRQDDDSGKLGAHAGAVAAVAVDPEDAVGKLAGGEADPAATVTEAARTVGRVTTDDRDLPPVHALIE